MYIIHTIFLIFVIFILDHRFDRLKTGKLLMILTMSLREIMAVRTKSCKFWIVIIWHIIVNVLVCLLIRLRALKHDLFVFLPYNTWRISSPRKWKLPPTTNGGCGR